MKLPPIDMIVAVSSILDEYGLNMSLWYPIAMDSDWGSFFPNMKRLDVLFIPGGDGGSLTVTVQIMFTFAQQKANLVRQSHPFAEVWVSCQAWNESQMELFYETMQEPPSWLTGVIFGPQTRDPFPVLNQRLPASVLLSQYPDLGHGMISQYPNPEWPYAYAYTEGREVVNPRPSQHSKIAKMLLPGTVGFGAYSDGCNDDVNKIIWSALGWNSSVHYHEVLKDYAKYFIRPDYADSFAKGLANLELNWYGRLESNKHVEETLQLFQQMESTSKGQDLLNWRFQQHYFEPTMMLL